MKRIISFFNKIFWSCARKKSKYKVEKWPKLAPPTTQYVLFSFFFSAEMWVFFIISFFITLKKSFHQFFIYPTIFFYSIVKRNGKILFPPFFI